MSAICWPKSTRCYHNSVDTFFNEQLSLVYKKGRFSEDYLPPGQGSLRAPGKGLRPLHPHYLIGLLALH